MCGICGAIALDGPLAPGICAALPAMTAAIGHRGPDAEGFFTDDVAALGHRRLSIIDLATGDQPMTSEDRSRWIVFNGEIYNHREVRRQLVSRGHVFRTSSDTEAILHAYEEYGSGCVDRLEGMFAFAVYDSRERSLFLARDRLGKKPLFYAALGGALHFASEMKCFYASPAWDPALDPVSLEGYLSLGYYVAPDTVYRHVKKLEPGHWLRLSGGRITVRRYWDVTEFDTDHRPEREVLEELEPLIRSAVTDRLESEVPLGAFLSGGIDSGLVVSFMAEAGLNEVVTATVGFGGDANNELEAAGLTARAFHTSHHPHVIEPNLEELLGPVVTAFDEPFADSSAIPTWYVCRTARQHVTVALSGDGGDETFAGYDFRYVPHAIESWARAWLPGSPGRRAVRALGRRWPRSARLPRALRLGTILDNVSRSAADAYYLDLCMLKPVEARRLLGRPDAGDPRESPVYEAVTGPYIRCPSNRPVQKAQYADLKVYMPNDPLVKVDRMSMQHALEVRCPLLDRRLVEFAFRLPTETKMPRLRGKHLLRTLAARRLPQGLSRLPKRGFEAPVGAWLAGSYAEQYRNEVLGPTGVLSSMLDTRYLRRLFEEHHSGRQGHASALWACWVLQRWAARAGTEAGC
jgi:asparagine synthase (glutamine-hydrolysing)